MEDDLPLDAFKHLTLADMKRSDRWDRLWNAYLNEHGVRIDRRRTMTGERVQRELSKMAEMQDFLC